MTAFARRWQRCFARGVLVVCLQAAVWASQPGDADRMASAAQARGPKADAGWQALRPVLLAAIHQGDVVRLQSIISTTGPARSR